MPIQVNFPYGVWESNDTARRWRFVLTNGGCTWDERRPTGPKRRSVPLTSTGDGK
jgi:hypothetical protein